MAINKELLRVRFQHATQCSDPQSHTVTQRYLQACAREVLRNLTHDREYFSIGMKHLLESCGRVTVHKKTFYVWKVFQSIPERIFHTPEDIASGLGSNLTKRNTMAQSNYTLEDIIIASGNREQLVQHLYEPFVTEVMNDAVDLVPINQISLQNYILANQAIDRADPHNAKQAHTLDYNLKQAQRILLIAQVNDGQLPQVISESAFGRKYYKGPNLQNCPKIVRHAALGACHEYDLESSVFAWKLSLFRDICREQGTSAPAPAILEYLDRKSAVRTQVTQDVFGTEDEYYVNIIKQAITAVGFGAPMRATGYAVDGRYQTPALNTIITGQQQLKRFLENAWVREFAEEQKTLNEIIYLVLKQYGHDQEWIKIPELLDKGGRLRINQVISYLYQQAERQIIQDVITQVQHSEILLTVHDCIYTRLPIKMRHVREQLKTHGEFFDVSHTEHRSYYFDTEQAEHVQRIAAEEQRAAEIYGTHTLPGVKRAKTQVVYNSDSACWDGSGYDGSGYENYTTTEDIFFDHMPEQERREYEQAREHVLENRDLPDWVKQRLV